MVYVATGFVLIWTAVLLSLAGRAFDLSRRALNNIIPGTPYWDRPDYYRHFTSCILRRRDPFGLSVDPASLTDAGRRYQERAIRIEWIALAWMAGGIGPLVWACSYLMAP